MRDRRRPAAGGIHGVRVFGHDAPRPGDECTHEARDVVPRVAGMDADANAVLALYRKTSISSRTSYNL
jgi:hypothetical protein